MQKLQSSLELSSGSTYAQKLEEHRSKLAAMSDAERAQYFADVEERRRTQDRQDVLRNIRRTAQGRIKHSGIPERFAESSIDDFDSNIQAFAKAIKNGGKESLIIRGDVGTRKTGAGCAILNHVVQTRSVRFVTMHHFMMLMNDVFVTRTRSREDIFYEYATIPVLMIDDLGKELTGANTDNIIVQLFNLINERWSNERPTIITTQYDSTGLFNMLTSRDGGTANARAILDRLKTYNSIVFGGKSQRKQEKLDLGLEE